MDISEYRKKYLEKLESDAKERPSFRDFLDEVKSKKSIFEAVDTASNTATAEDTNEQDDAADAANIIRDGSEDTEVRIRALRGITYEIGQSAELIDLMFELLAGETEPVELRLTVLSILQLNEFISPVFPSKRSQYLEILRNIVDDPNAELRLQVIAILAKFKDEYVQRRLLEGLQNEAEPLVPPEKAIQLLGYDIHTEFFPVLKDIVKDPPNLLAKNEAVRLLAADSDSKNLLTEILQDKDESKKVRQTSAIALQSLAPAEFQAQAQEIIFDDSEYDDIRATCINALEDAPDFSGGEEAMDFSGELKSLDSTGDNALLKKVEELKDTGSSLELRKVAERFLTKRKR